MTAIGQRGRGQQNTLERKIHFFRAHAGNDEAGRPLPIDVIRIFECVENLHYTDGERYVDVGDGNVACAWLDQPSAPHRMRLATIRRMGLPMIEDGGILSSLNLGTQQGLYEAIHVCFFPQNIVGLEFNFYGPRPSRLSSYLGQVTDGVCPPFVLEPLLRQDVLDQLDNLAKIKLFDLAVRRSLVSTVSQADQDLGSAFEAAVRAGDSQVVRIILEPEPHARGTWLRDAILPATRRLAQLVGLRESAKKFVVKGLDLSTNRIEIVDVLQDQLIASKRIIRADPRSRALDDGDAYRAIEEAYAELRSDLEIAASVNNV